MLVLASKKQVNLDQGKLVTEASSLGLKPGEWPLFIALLDEKYEGHLFQKGNPIPSPEGEISAFNYYSRQGLHMVVFND